MSRLPKIESSREATGDGWAFYNADCYDILRQVPDNSIGMSIYSPPFASLYVFSDSERDMSNCRDDEEFMAQYRLMLPELYRVTRPGRLCVVHCQDMLSYANQQGRAGYRDFPGKLIAAHSDAGFQFHSRVTVWKNPEDEVSRTKTSSLLWSQMLRDSTVSRQARADYLLVFRKWAEEGQELEPVTHREEDFPLDQWIKWASPTWETNEGEAEHAKFMMESLPVWMHVQPTDVLNVKEAKDNRDERHMCIARDSLVLTGSGFKPIQDVSIGDSVLTHLGRWRPVTAKVCNGVRDTITVKGHGIPGLQCTRTHRVLTRDGVSAHSRKKAQQSTPEWKNADSTLGSYLNLRTTPTVEKDSLSVDEWWIVGRYLGDGHMTKRLAPYISCSHEEVSELVEKLGAHAGRVYPKDTGPQVYVRGSGGKGGHHDDPLHVMIRKCGTGALVKQLPPDAFGLNVEKSEALLAGYLSADGHLDAIGRWYATSVSRSLLLGMAIIAQKSRGVVASVYRGRLAREHVIRGKVVHSRDEFIMMFSPRNMSGFLADDGGWKKVRSIHDSGPAEVWDLQVADDESFTVEGCVVHNCPLQLDLSARAIQLWSNPGDVVLSPFGGIGSEGVSALKHGRRFLGTEIKDTYFSIGKRNLESSTKQLSLFTNNLAEKAENQLELF